MMSMHSRGIAHYGGPQACLMYEGILILIDSTWIFAEVPDILFSCNTDTIYTHFNTLIPGGELDPFIY